MSSLLRKFRLKLDSFPCLILLAGILNGFAAIYLSDAPVSNENIFLLATPGIILAGILLGLRSCCYRFIPATCLAVISSILLIAQTKVQFREQHMENLDRLGASAVFRLTDPSLCGGSPDWLPNTPYYVQAELQSVTIGDPGTEETAAETVLLTIFPNNREISRLGYGDLIEAEGFFERVSEPVLPGTFDFPAYAAARGSSLLFHAESVKPLKRGSGFLRSLYDWRGNFLSELTSKMPKGAARDMAPALFFGIRQPIKGEIKNDFLYSGTLHVLSVSGFHIGLFFVAVMFFFSVFPYRFRWFAAPVPVFLYALSTGMQAPAFRAFLMLTLWCLAHVFLRNNRGMNSLAAAAGIILLLNPYQLFDIGFIYSFLCVFFLILSSNFFSEVSKAMTVRNQFDRDRKFFTFRGLCSKFVLAIGVSVAAWLCSMAVSLHFQSLFTPWAVPAYLLMIPVTWYCFALFLPAVLLQWIPGAVEGIGEILAPALELCALIAEKFADAGAFYISPPPVWLGVIFLFALAGLFIFRQRWSITICALLLFISGFFQFFPVPPPDPEIVILRHGATTVPSIIFCDIHAKRATVWNVPQGNTARLVSDYLKTRGIDEIDELHFDAARAEICGGGQFLLKITPANAVYFHEKIRSNTKTAKQIRKSYPQSASQPLLKLQKVKNQTEAVPGYAAMKHVRVRMTTSPYKGSVIEVILPDQTLRREYPLSNKTVVERITLPSQKRAEWQSLLSR